MKFGELGATARSAATAVGFGLSDLSTVNGLGERPMSLAL
jgi:hypothetical protein